MSHSEEQFTKSTSFNQETTFSLFKGSSTEFFRKYSRYLAKEQGTIVVGLNCGFGNFEVGYTRL